MPHDVKYILMTKLIFLYEFQVMNILKYLFPVPKDDSRRILTFSNDDDYISFRYLLLYYSTHSVNLRRNE